MVAWGSYKCCLATPQPAGCDPEGGQGRAGMPTLCQFWQEANPSLAVEFNQQVLLKLLW